MLKKLKYIVSLLIVVVSAVVLGFASINRVSAKGPLVEICHYTEEIDSWFLIEVAEPAVDAHFRKHDDAFPGEETSQSATQLSDECVEVVGVSCPCDFSVAGLEEIFIDGSGSEACNVGAPTFIQAVSFAEGGVAHVGILPGDIFCARSLNYTTRIEEVHGLTIDEYNACYEDILTNAPPCAGN